MKLHRLAGWTLAALLVAGCGGGGGGTNGGNNGGNNNAQVRSGAVGVPVTANLSGTTTVGLAGVTNGDEYELILGSTADPTGDASLTVNAGTTPLAQLPASRAATLTRDAGPKLGFHPRPLTAGRQAATRSFDLSGTGFDVTVTAKLRTTGQHALFYVDTSVPETDFTDANLADLMTQFDQHIYPTDTALFGQPSDVDQNGKVILLFSPYINQRGYGVFYSGDLYPGGNFADMLYVLVPQPSQGKDYASLRTGLLATLAHEFQHLINFNDKAFVNHLSQDEESWLNEALSFNAEQQNGYQDSPGGSPEDVGLYSKSPELYTLRELTGNYKKGHAGAGYLFVRYLVDRFGADVLTRLDTSAQVGEANVAAATGVSFNELFRTWAAAVYLNQTGLSSDPVYAIPGMNTRGTYLYGGTLTGPRATVVDASSGQPAFTATWARGGLRFLRFNHLPSTDVVLSVTASAADQVQMTLIRVPAGSP